MIDYKKIAKIEDRIRKNKQKLTGQIDSKQRQILDLKISIDEYKVRLEKLK